MRRPERSMNEADVLAGELAHNMLLFIAARFANATDEEKLELTVRYGPVMLELQKTISKAARWQRRQNFPGNSEHKSA